jgi:hypothetical protein
MPIEAVNHELDLTPEHPILSESEGDMDFKREGKPIHAEDRKEEHKSDAPSPLPDPPVATTSSPAQPITYPTFPSQAIPQDPMTFMYVSMLQQQITALQTQLLSRANPILESKPTTRTIGVNTDMPPIAISVAVSTDPLPSVMEMGVNTEIEMIGDQDVTPKASPELKPILMSTKLSEWDDGIQKTESSIPVPTEPSFPMPADTGSNYKALYEFEDPSKAPSIVESEESDISFAQKVIPQLVSNAEQSFVYREDEPETMGPNVFSNTIPSSFHHEPAFEMNETIAKQLNDFSLDQPSKSSAVEDLSSLRDLSLSFDSVNYLKRHGLS